MARSVFVISVDDSSKAKQLIETFLLNKKAKEVVYQKEIVWQFGNALVGKKYLKVEYDKSEVKIQGWVPINSTGGEMDLTGVVNWLPKSELLKIIEQIEELLKREC